MRAYALMRHAVDLEREYWGSSVHDDLRPDLQLLRDALRHIRFAAYRGIGRYPFTEYPQHAPGMEWAGRGEAPESESRARQAFVCQLPPDDFRTPYPRSFLAEAGQVQAIRALLVAPQLFEIVELCSGRDLPKQRLGFDIGYWGGGNFSILCDAAIWPLWHPPVPEVFNELADVTRELNAHALFPTSESAHRYLEWYSRQAWAEKEPSEFCVIAVSAWHDAESGSAPVERVTGAHG
jgi:hypothetical protein